MKNTQTYDVIITGGGIMGSATAYYLTKADPALKVAVVERDPSYARASTTLSMSNVRIQFSLKENIQISQYAFQVLERFEEEMAVEDRTAPDLFSPRGQPVPGGRTKPGRRPARLRSAAQPRLPDRVVVAGRDQAALSVV